MHLWCLKHLKWLYFPVIAQWSCECCDKRVKEAKEWKGEGFFLPSALTCIFPFPREYLANNVSVTVYPVNEPWLYSILWCSGVPSVSSDAPQILQKVPYPIWLMVNSSPLSVPHLTPHAHTQTRSRSEARGQQETGQRLTRAQQDSGARTQRNMRELSGRL